MNNTSCKNCEHWRKAKAKLTYSEIYDRDTRPECKGFLNRLYWWWNPNYFRIDPPDDWELQLDEAIIKDNKHLGYCVRFPKAVQTVDSYFCGEFSRGVTIRVNRKVR